MKLNKIPEITHFPYLTVRGFCHKALRAYYTNSTKEGKSRVLQKLELYNHPYGESCGTHEVLRNLKWRVCVKWNVISLWLITYHVMLIAFPARKISWHEECCGTSNCVDQLKKYKFKVKRELYENEYGIKMWTKKYWSANNLIHLKAALTTGSEKKSTLQAFRVTTGCLQ